MEYQARHKLKDKRRIVIKIGSSSLTHSETGEMNLMKIERLVRVISDLRGQGKDVILVSSGAIAAGRQALGYHKRPGTLAEIRSCLRSITRRQPRFFLPRTQWLTTAPDTMRRTPLTSF